MSYDIITKEEAAEAGKKEWKPWAPGIYDFTVIDNIDFCKRIVSTEETKSKIKEGGKGGNPMTIVCLKVFQKDGSDMATNLVDYVVMTGTMAWKYRHLAEATGNEAKYEAKTLTIGDILYKSGKLELGIEKGSAKGDGTFYNDKNIIADYIPKDTAESKNDDLDDSIPF